jgi:response regulator RpfG family c-di-GMP phosphodiesterase
MDKPQPRVLCVDDEPNILDAMKRTMGAEFTLVTALGGQEGLTRLQDDPGYAVIVSDLRMPVVDGVSFLRAAAECTPDSVRILLTGHADLDHAIAAINDGRIFRFLTKPCAASILRSAISAGCEQHRLVTSERVLLQQTLRGSIRALVDIVSVIHPAIGARTSRVRRGVTQLAEALEADDVWQMEIAALLANLGYVTLPAATVEKVHAGTALNSHERSMLAATPAAAARLIENIPRLDEVRRALAQQHLRWDGRDHPPGTPRGPDISLGARLIRLVTDLDQLESQGMPRQRAIAELHGHSGCYDPNALAALTALDGKGTADGGVEAVAVHALASGMIFEEDLLGHEGALMVARGAEVTQALVARIHDYWDDIMKQRVVRVRRPGTDARAQAAA